MAEDSDSEIQNETTSLPTIPMHHPRIPVAAASVAEGMANFGGLKIGNQKFEV